MKKLHATKANIVTSLALLTCRSFKHSPSSSRRHAKRFAIDFALVAPIGAVLALGAIVGRLARDVVEERLGLVITHSHRLVFFLFVFAGAGFVARIVLFVRFAVDL